MQKRKYIQLVQTLSVKELRRFGEYLQSPFFNKNQRVINLFQFLKKYHPTYTQTKCTLQNAYKQIYSTGAYNEQKFRNLLSEMSKLLEEFIVQKALEEERRYKSYELLKYFHAHNLEKFFLKKLQEAHKIPNNFIGEEIEFYYHKYVLERLAYSFQVANKGRVLDTSLPKVVERLDDYYLADKLRYCCILFNRKNFMISEMQMPLLSELLHYLSKISFENKPVIAIWYHLLLLLREEEKEAHFTNLKELLNKYSNVIFKGELRQIYVAVINYCNKKLTSGKTHYLREIFELYQQMLEQEVLLQNGFIAPYMHYRNIVRVGVRLGEIEWTEKFIYAYKEKLQPSIRENIFNYCLAVLHFYKGDYQESLNYLFGFEFQDFYHYIEHKTLLAKTYYELEESEALEALLHAFRVYLGRNTHIPEHYQLIYHNFIKIMNKILKYRWEFKGEKNALMAELTAIQYVTDKEWLLQKATELK